MKIIEKKPNAEFQAAIDECDAMVRGEIPLPLVQTVDSIFAECGGIAVNPKEDMP